MQKYPICKQKDIKEKYIEKLRTNLQQKHLSNIFLSYKIPVVFKKCLIFYRLS